MSLKPKSKQLTAPAEHTFRFLSEAPSRAAIDLRSGKRPPKSQVPVQWEKLPIDQVGEQGSQSPPAMTPKTKAFIKDIEKIADQLTECDQAAILVAAFKKAQRNQFLGIDEPAKRPGPYLSRPDGHTVVDYLRGLQMRGLLTGDFTRADLGRLDEAAANAVTEHVRQHGKLPADINLPRKRLSKGWADSEPSY